MSETPRLIDLVRTRRFGPLFAGLCLGAFGDNLYRQALVILVEFKLAALYGMDAGQLVALAPAIFMLPYFIFSAMAGQMADRIDKARWMQQLKFAEIFIMALAAWALVESSLYGLFAALFFAGLQAAFYSPVKYAIMPQHLKEDELLGGNAVAGAGIYLAILIGAILGGMMILAPQGELIVGGLMVATSIAGWLTSLYILPAPPSAQAAPLSRDPLTAMTSTLKAVWPQPTIPLVIAGHAWFWFISSLYVGQMPTMTHDILNASQGVFTLFFTLFSVGIGFGALLVRQLLGSQIDGRFTVFGAMGLAVSGSALAISLQNFGTSAEVLTVAAFLSTFSGWLILSELVLLAICGGIYIVPINTLLQARAKEELRASTIAACNVIDAGAMVASSLLAVGLLELGFSIPTIWLLAALGSFAAIPVIITLVPQMALKRIFQQLLRAAFDVEISGLQHLEQAGPKAVIVANHVSLLDGLLLAAFLPGRALFAVDSQIAEKWWVKPFLALVEAYRMDPTQPMALKGLINRVSEGAHCVIFPEGRITTTGGLMKINEGPGLIADKAGAPIVPIRIEGAEYTRFSYLKGMVRRRMFPRVRLVVQPAVRFSLPDEVKGRDRRALAGQKLYDLMSNLIFETSPIDETLIEALLDARDLHGGNRPVLEDKDRKAITYSQIITRMIILGRKFAPLAPRGGRVGLMLPSTNAAVISMLALQSIGRTPAMLNFSAGAASNAACCAAAQLSHIITSRRFIEMARLELLAETLAAQATLVYLEDLSQSITPLDKLYGLLLRPFARTLHRHYEVKADEAAVVLFTSGSEGTPKGVVLSHKNLLANRWQIGARLDFSPKDIILNALPLFHSFGLTGGLLIPLLGGARTVLYPSPLHYRIVPLLSYDCNATILFGTDTFLTGYARTAHPYDFYSLRFICAGAEKVREETRRIYADRYGVRILEGYGATETAPVIAVNTFMHSKMGTVGRLLPGMKAKLQQIPGIAEGGRLLVSGPNIMMGYLKAEKPGQLQPPERDDAGLWHDTGDIVNIDAEGYLRILGRAKRFAKIAGEMVSFGAVEALVERTYTGFAHGVVAIADVRIGVQLVLSTTCPTAKVEDILSTLKAEGQSELLLPRQILILDALPLLGSGKTDYVELLKLVKDRFKQELE